MARKINSWRDLILKEISRAFSGVSADSHTPCRSWNNLVCDINEGACGASVFLNRFSMTLLRQESKPRKNCISSKDWGRNVFWGFHINCLGKSICQVYWLIGFYCKTPCICERLSWRLDKVAVMYTPAHTFYKSLSSLQEAHRVRPQQCILGGVRLGDLMTMASMILPPKHSYYGNGILPFEEEAQGGHEKPWVVAWQNSFLKN